MAANVETMFSTRTKPWHGLGTIVAEAPDSKAALGYAGLDWNVIRREVFTEERTSVPGVYANVRDSDFTTLGIVSERYCSPESGGFCFYRSTSGRRGYL